MTTAASNRREDSARPMDIDDAEDSDDTSTDEKYSRDGSYHTEDDMSADELDAHRPPPRGDPFILGDTILPPVPEPPTIPKVPSSGPNAAPARKCPSFLKLVESHLELGYGLLFLFLLWGTLWGITETQALPGGNLFSLFILLLACYVAGRLVSLISVPPLLGMLLMGCLLRNVPVINCAKEINPKWASSLRLTALVVILTRAGLGLDPKVLRKLSRTCLQLAFLPCLIEALVVALASHLLLDLPVNWAFLAGFTIAAVSPAVVVSLMIRLQDQGYGSAKGIPVLVIASSSIDDILAITAFGIVLSTIFATGESIAWIALQGPVQAVLGIVYGSVMGICFWFIPMNRGSTALHAVMLFGGAMFVTFVSPLLDLGSMGPLGTLTMAFMAALSWREQGILEGPKQVFAMLWIVFEPFLFGLIGAEVDFSLINFEQIGLCCATLIVGLVIRVGVSMLSVSCANFTLAEILFVAIAWVPKATVQAALGPIALDMARRQGNVPHTKDLALQVLTLAVVSIVITAPLGAIGINLAGPRLLKKSPSPVHN